MDKRQQQEAEHLKFPEHAKILNGRISMSFTVENIFNERDRFDKCSAHNGHSELAQRLNPDTSRIREIFLIDNRQNIQLWWHREGRREGSERELVGIIYTNRI